MLSGLLLVGFGMIVTKRSSRSLTFMAAIAFLYFGIVRGGCICPVGSVANLVVGLKTPNMLGRITLAIFLIPLVAAWLFGRVFCTTACPLGTIQHLLYKRKKFIRLPRVFLLLGIVSTVLILLATIHAALFRSRFLICELDPYRVLFFNGYAWFKQVSGMLLHNPQPEHVILLACSGGILIYTAVILLIGWWIPRPFCRFVCPYGVLLGLLAMVAFRRRTIDSQSCVYCGQCEKACPVQAITINRAEKEVSLSSYHCVQCGKCSDACRFDSIKS
jgi:polyferredoxin